MNTPVYLSRRCVRWKLFWMNNFDCNIKPGLLAGLKGKVNLRNDGRCNLFPHEADAKGKGGGRPGAYTRKTGLYAGTYRVAEDHSKAKSYRFPSHQRVSKNNARNAWWHPGIPGRRLVSQGRSSIGGIVKENT